MKTLAQSLSEDRRLTILQALAEDAEYRLPETSLQRVVSHMLGTVYPDHIRAELQYLSEHRLLTVDRMRAPGGGELWVATLTPEGHQVSRGRVHPGVSRPEPR
ncbi:MAG: hypothetical protein E7K72_11790 [Roseomonas mucosa]|nr:hypothetical protein [Roseomonas mucosa]